ncbi:thymidylate kinase [Streptomyces sp. URMC 125]|uniref:thymidylate kinase n=1 Tax=Streptomyces sp. URMC 125 TaxID=3423419 RepID=UPI003F1C1F22
MHPTGSHPGLLVSIEGVNGVGKDYLLQHARPRLTRPSRTIAEFSARMRATGTPGLSQQILRAMARAADGDHFLRGGAPHSETLLLLAVKTHDYESALPHLLDGATVVEGRSLHSTAVYQSLILDSADPLPTARRLLGLGARWRPLPDTTVLVTDDLDAALARAEQRDGRTFTPEERTLHRRAEELFRELADGDDRTRVLDRRLLAPGEAAALMAQWIDRAAARKAAGAAAVPRPRGVSDADEQVSS